VNKVYLRRISPDQLPSFTRDIIGPETIAQAAKIVFDVRRRKDRAVLEHAYKLGDIKEGQPLTYTKDELNQHLEKLDEKDRGLLERVQKRIKQFAEAQKECLASLSLEIDGGNIGHRIEPVQKAGCYAPGGRFPLPSSVLMTVNPAKVAGVKEVWVASPKPTPLTLAAAGLAGADGLLAVGGAQAISALAFGTESVPGCDVVVGPGNRWVTAAKQLVAPYVGIDMLAGPSELVVLADSKSNPAWIAADLLAQAEHDPDALPILISLDEEIIEQVEIELEAQIKELDEQNIAFRSLNNGFSILAVNTDIAIELCNRIAPEHLSLFISEAESLADRFCSFGSLFIGQNSAEVLADYGAGPNHVLPTGGSARFQAGLSVFTFLKLRTWMTINDLKSASRIIDDSISLARIEGLQAHAKAAQIRLA
jgi:phosphoribosyl-ATP pyrophosphohydrolase/phosphoribosyl-AMP cyclohydrolase/histidinol dehydrogenase